MHYVYHEELDYHNNIDCHDQDLSPQLYQALNLIDIGTASSIIEIINSKTNNPIHCTEWIDRIHNALNFIDRGMLGFDYQAVKKSAKLISKKINKFYLATNHCDPEALVALFYSEENHSLQAPVIRLPPNKSKEKFLTNIINEVWWKNILNETIEQNREQLRKLIGLVNEHSPYASDQAVKGKRISDKRKAKYLKQTFVFSKKTGKNISLADTIKTKEQGFSEKWCILKGYDEYAQKNGMSSAMITITTPAEYHVSPSNLSRLTAIDANEWISNKWHKITKSFFRHKNQYFGVRVVEANIDGTPHWHVLIYFADVIKEKLQSILMRAFKVQELDNPLIKWQDTNREIGTFLSYMTKSIVPSSLASFNRILSGNNVRIEAFRSTWDIRSIQFLGLPKGCVKTWQTLRKLVNRKVADKKVSNLLTCIKENDFCTFLTAYMAGNIALKFSKDKKITDIKIFELSIFNKKDDQKIENVKVNPINNLNNRDTVKTKQNSNNISTCFDFFKKITHQIKEKILNVQEKLSITSIFKRLMKNNSS